MTTRYYCYGGIETIKTKIANIIYRPQGITATAVLRQFFEKYSFFLS